MKRPLFLFIIMLCLPACLMDRSQKPVSVAEYGASEGVGTLGVHTAMEGDTLWTISQRYNISMRDIALANDLQPPYKLSNGQRLRLPPPLDYRARPGDNIYTVSQLFRASPSQIAAQNNLSAPYRIEPGQILHLPSISAGRQDLALDENGAAVEPQSPSSPDAAPGAADQTPLALDGQIADVASVDAQTLPPPISLSPPPPAAAMPPMPRPAARAPTRINPAPDPVMPKAAGKFIRPVQGRIISSYGSKPEGLHNDGINIEAPRGTPVKAAENGIVVYAGNELKGSGNLVLVRHPGRWMSAYAHMDSLNVKRGDAVKYGQAIGTVGSTGSVDTPQLHFELRRGTQALNPEVYLQ